MGWCTAPREVARQVWSECFFESVRSFFVSVLIRLLRNINESWTTLDSLMSYRDFASRLRERRRLIMVNSCLPLRKEKQIIPEPDTNAVALGKRKIYGVWRYVETWNQWPAASNSTIKVIITKLSYSLFLFHIKVNNWTYYIAIILIKIR